MTSEIMKKIESFCEGKEYSTHHVSDKQQTDRLEQTKANYIIIDDIILEWLDKGFPIPSKEDIIATELSPE